MKEKIGKQLDRLRYVLLGGALIAAVSVATLQLRAENSGRAHAADVHVKVDDTPIKREGGAVITSFAPVVKEVAPSVVTISVTQKGQRLQMRGNPLMQDPFLGRLFGGGNDQGELRTPDRQGLGSGVIISKDGYILTNNHVVQDADEVEVRLSSGKKDYTAKVVGADPKSDVAVLKIDAHDLPAITFGDSDQIEVGDLVLAVGNPFGIGQTVTMGMVSATGRGNMGLDYEDFIQTDAAINPGNSGGALVDAHGRLIGINTAIISRSGGNQGIGFAVPVNLARSVMESLVENGRVIRGFLGVNIQNVNQDLADAFKLDKAQGALVAQVSPDSPAEKAGLKDGDVIVGFNGKDITDSRHLKLMVGETLPGTKVPVEIVRDGHSKTLEVTLKELPGDKQLASNNNMQNNDTERLAGVVVSDIDQQTRRQLELPRKVDGALVTNVDPESAAYKAGLRQGDVIMEIDREQVNNGDDAVKAANDAKGDQILLRVWSQGGSRYLVVNESRQS
ncbi:Do family serine endopeptidase [bacterium]|nr:Do family serine endopeptidase [bacterium]